MQIAIIGAGAMGGLFGGRLAASGQDVSMIDRPGPHLDAMRADGLLLDIDGRAERIPVRVGVAGEFSGQQDLLIVFTKGTDTVAALNSCRHLAGPGTAVLTLQNGLGHAERVGSVLPQAALLIGMTDWPADLRGPGHVVSHGHGVIKLWSADGADTPVVHAVTAALNAAGLRCAADPEVTIAIWEKVAFNAAMNTVTAIGRVTVGALADSPDGRRLVHEIVEETLAVARAHGVDVVSARVHATIAKAFAGHRDHQSSMLQDVLAGRQTEIETINGSIVALGEALGIPTPVTRTMRDLVRLVDARQEHRI